MDSARRIDWIDGLKGLLMIMVVLGHCIQFGSGPDMIVNKSYFDDIVFRFIYSFHMPAFALVSGYFFKSSAGQKEGIGKKAKTLLVPVMVWSFLVAAVLLIKSSLQGGDILDNITDFSRIILTYLWFLRASFVSFVLIWLVKRFCKDSILIHILILTVSLFIPDWLNTELWKFTYPFFVAGYYWNVCNLNYLISAAQTAVLLVLFYGCDRIIRRFPASRALLLGGR